MHISLHYSLIHMMLRERVIKTEDYTAFRYIYQDCLLVLLVLNHWPYKWRQKICPQSNGVKKSVLNVLEARHASFDPPPSPQ